MGEIPVEAVAPKLRAPEVKLVEGKPEPEEAEVAPEVLHEEPDSPDVEEAVAASEKGAAAALPPTNGNGVKNQQLKDVMAHLVFHKSLIRDADPGANIERYLSLAQDVREGVHLVIDNPFDKCIALVFELVINERLNPWDIDLRQFAKLYLSRVKDQTDIDFIAAGKLMLMAWSILKSQTDEVLAAVARIEAQKKAEQDAALGQPDASMDFLDNRPWLGADETTYNFTKAVIEADPFQLNEAVHPPGERPVTLYDLISAFEEAKGESATRVVLEQERAKARADLDRARKARVQGMMHSENLETEIADTWMRVLERVHKQEIPAAKIPISALHNGTKQDYLTVFISSLFLAFNQRVLVSQEPIASGEIFLQLTPEAQKGNLPAMPAPLIVEPALPPGKKPKKAAGRRPPSTKNT